MVAGPGGQTQIQVRLGKRRAELVIGALEYYAAYSAIPDVRAEYIELMAWLRLRYVRQWGEDAPRGAFTKMTDRAAQ